MKELKYILYILGAGFTLITIVDIMRVKSKRLTRNFRLSEFKVTATGLLNIPDAQSIQNLQELAENVLQPWRNLINEGVEDVIDERGITITSGYRSHAVNKDVGGAKKSQHKIGEAADTVTTDLYNDFLLLVNSAIPFDQVIFETDKDGDQWIHTSYKSDGENRRQAMTANYNVVSKEMDYKNFT